MRLIIFFLLVATFSVHATSNAQNVTLRGKSITLPAIFNSINHQTGYAFVYDNALMKKAVPVSINVADMPLHEALDKCFKDQPFTYEIQSKVIVVKEKLFASSPPVVPGVRSAVITLSGTVTDNKGAPLANASVQVKGTSFGATTDAAGKFIIESPKNAGVLIVSYTGFVQQEIPFSGTMDFDIKLAPKEAVIEEVVVVGYGTQKKVSLTGAVDVVKNTALTDRPVVNLTQALQGTSPSLIVQNTSFEPGQPVQLNLRGVGTLGDNSPLIVIDGVVGGDINLLNPNDIDNISILKDAGSAAIYGSRSANGVILITTKKGKKGKGVINYNGIASLIHPHVLDKAVPSYENMYYKDEALVNSGQLPIYSPAQIAAQKAKGDYPYFLDALFHDAWQQNHNLSFSGGTGSTLYMISGGIMDQQSNYYGPRKGVRRYNYRMNLETEIGKLKISGKFAYARNEIRDHAAVTGFLIADAQRTPPMYPYKDSLGRYLINDVLTEFNPFGQLDKQGSRHFDNDNFFGNLAGELQLAKGLTLKGMFGMTLDANHEYDKTNYVPYFRQGDPVGASPAVAETFPGSGASVSDKNSKNILLNTQLLLQYARTFGKHDVTAMGGVTTESYTGKFNMVSMQYVTDDLGLPTSNTITKVDGQLTSPQRTEERALNSYIGRLTYGYDQRFFAEAAFRADGSSKFAKQNRWGYFPSFSGSWVVNREKFYQDSKVSSIVNDLKLRASYGILGNQNVGNYQYQTTYFIFSNAYGFNNTSVAGAGFNTANPDIRWETAKTLNAGVDMSFLKRKLTASFDFFRKQTDNILQRPTLPGTYGGSNVDFNIASVRNSGWELTLNYNTAGKNWRHAVMFNIANTSNIITKLGNNNQTMFQGADEMQAIYATGIPIGSYVGFKRTGYFQNLNDIENKPHFVGLNVAPGDNMYMDKNGDGVIDDNDRYVLGNPFPHYTFGFSYTVGYRDIDMVLFVQGVGQRSEFIRGELVEPFHQNYSYVIFQHELDFWRPDNVNAQFPRLAIAGSASNTNNFRKPSDMYIFNAAYARLKNIQIGYTLPATVSRKLGMQKFRIYLSGQNLLTLSKLKFLDPESSEFNSNLSAGGSNSARAYPASQYFGGGIDITF